MKEHDSFSEDKTKRIEDVRTGGHWLVKLLQSKQVEFVFGTTGAGMPDIQDAMVIEKPPKWIQGLHEFVTVNAASGYALASGKAGVALIDRIVGTQNSVGAFYGAYMNSSPVVILASANAPGVPIETDAVELHFSNYQITMIGHLVKWLGQLNDLSTLHFDLEKAFNAALSEHRGPVYFTLRQDLMAKRITEGWVSQHEQPVLSPRVPDDDTIAKIVNELVSHDRPQIIASHTGRHPDSVKAMTAFAHLFGISVTERRFFMNYPINDLLHMGFIDRYRAPETLPNTDLVLTLEFGFLPHQQFRQNLPVIDLFSDPLHRQDVYAGGDYGSSVFPFSIRAVCDIGPTLNKITKLGETSLSNSEKRRIKERKEEIAELHREILSLWREKAKNSFNSGKLDDWSVGYVLNRYVSGEMSWVNGAASGWNVLLKSVEFTNEGSYFSNPSGHLGVASGMAYGVALAHCHYGDVVNKGMYMTGSIKRTGHVTLCTIGDGDAIFGNIDSSLWTCSHYGIGVLYVILNNSCWAAEWGPIEESSQRWAKTSNDFEFLDLDRPNIDFSQIAQGFSVHSEKVETPEEFDSAVSIAKKIVEAGRPALIDVTLEKFTPGQSTVI